MLSELQQQRVWEGWLSAEIRANYFADLAGVYHRRQRWSTWLTLVASSGAAAAVLSKLPPEWGWAAPVLALATAALSLYSLVTQNQKSAMDSADLHHRWNKLANEYWRLWDSMYATEAADQLAKLEEVGEELSKVGTSFPAERRRLLRWQDHVERQHHLVAQA